MTYNYYVEDLYGLHALDSNLTPLARDGYGVETGCAVSINTGQLGAGENTLSIASGSVLHNDSSVTVNTQSVDIPDADGNLPRKDIVYIDAQGNGQVYTGDPEAADPSGATGVKTERPAPHHFADKAGVPLCEVWVGAEVTSVNSDDLTDRRVTPIDVGPSYSDEQAQDAVGNNVGNALSYDDGTGSISVSEPGISHDNIADVSTSDHHVRPSAGTGLSESSNTFNLDAVVSGQTTLSSGSATVDTAISTTDATFMLALGVDDPNADCKVSGRLFWDDSAGTYKVEIVETQTTVGNPTVNYDVIRVR